MHGGTSPDEFPCPGCSQHFSSSAERANHIKTAHNKDSSYICNFCPFTTIGPVQLHTHTQASQLGHAAHLLLCGHESCKLRFPSAASRQRHLELDHQELHVCTLCGYQNNSVNAISVHFTHMHQEKTQLEWKCMTCQRLCESEEELLNHRRVALQERGWPCRWCKMCFCTPADAQEHQARPSSCVIKLDDEPSSTKLSKITISNDGRETTLALKPPSRATFLERRFECPRCDAQLTKSGLRSHESNALKNPQICLGCTKCFCNKTLLEGHERRCALSKRQKRAAFKAHWAKLATGSLL